ncbi:hypothetical protein [Winogradskya humida]|nr:hypothetical protein [Actinoplanes humidus]
MLLAVCLVASFSAEGAGTAAVATARVSAPELRSVGLTDANPVTGPGRCTQIALTGRIATTDAEVTSVTTTVRDETGGLKPTLGLRRKESGSITAVSDRVRLCGLDAKYAADYVGRFTWTLMVRYAGGVVSVERSFRLRYQGLVSFNAAPEPVHRGSWVTLTGWVSDGWEYVDTHPIAIYFKADNSTTWTRRGSLRPRCISYCGDGDAATWEAKGKFRQSRSGVWKAISTRTTYLASGTRSDRVAVSG